MMKIAKGIPCQLYDQGKLHAPCPSQKTFESYAAWQQQAVTYPSADGLRPSRSSVEHKGVSYSTIKDEFRFSVSLTRFLNSDILNRHAGWNNPASKNRYIEYKVNDLLQSLGL